jgi:hypothetical protein
VSSKYRAAILPSPLPQDFDFQLPDMTGGSEITLGTNQQSILTAIVDKIYSEEEANEVRSGLNKRLYVFGTISYRDAYQINR